MLTILNLLGQNAKLILPLGILFALCLPETEADITIIVPPLIMMIYAVTFIRMDLMAMLRETLSAAHLFQQMIISAVILIIMPIILIGIAYFCGLDALLMPSAVWYAVAPPIASTAWICSLMGLSLPVAMRIIIMTSLLAPFTGPFIGSMILGDATGLSSWDMFINLATMIFVGVVVALIGQVLLGPARIARNTDSFNGLAALAMLLFLIPIFNGMTSQIILNPWLALSLLILATILNFSTQLVLMLLARFTPSASLAELASVMAVVGGNRNVGLYYGALPPDPVFSMFTALYQFPLYLTPLLMGQMRRLMGLDR
jgi:hypothetical protein